MGPPDFLARMATHNIFAGVAGGQLADVEAASLRRRVWLWLWTVEEDYYDTDPRDINISRGRYVAKVLTWVWRVAIGFIFVGSAVLFGFYATNSCERATVEERTVFHNNTATVIVTVVEGCENEKELDLFLGLSTSFGFASALALLGFIRRCCRKPRYCHRCRARLGVAPDRQVQPTNGHVPISKLACLV